MAKPQEILFKKCNILNIVKEVNSLLQSEANMHSVKLTLIAEENIPMVSCDSNQLKQVFINIIKNAIEASSKGGMVQVNVLIQNHDHILIQVKDNGVGISAERLERIGEPFFSHKEKGTGLGLTICFRIIEAHKGKIFFESQLGKGTTVDIILPVERDSMQ